MEDKTLVCSDCGAEFTFTVGEQNSTKKRALIMSQRDVRHVETRRRLKESCTAGQIVTRQTYKLFLHTQITVCRITPRDSYLYNYFLPNTAQIHLSLQRPDIPYNIL